MQVEPSLRQVRSELHSLASYPHHALTVPELLAAIFSCLSKADLTRAARVCRFWTPLALDLIWEAIQDFDNLMNTYHVIMQKEGTENQESHNMSKGSRWDAFWTYCRRVRTIQSCRGVYLPGVIEDLKSQLANRSCGPSLLPNLRSLAMEMCVDEPHVVEVLPIIPAGLQTLDLYIGRITSATLPRLLSHLTVIPLSHLSSVYLYSYAVDTSFTMANFLQPNRATLVHLTLPSFPLTVSGLKQLGSFPGVTRLLLRQKGAADELQEFFGVIGSSFPHLRHLDVTLDYAIMEDVSFAIIEGLAGCRELRIMYLQSHGWKALSEEDVNRFGSWWPEMEVFHLNQHHNSDQGKTSFGILQDFARVWYRTLRNILLQFDGAAPLPSPPAVEFKFEKLVTLGVGGSRISESSIEGIAGFLTMVSSGWLDVHSSDSEVGNCRPNWDAVMNKVNAKLSCTVGCCSDLTTIVQSLTI